MVEEDPNEETYYEMGYRDNPIPVGNYYNNIAEDIQ